MAIILILTMWKIKKSILLAFVITLTACTNPNVPDDLQHFCRQFSFQKAIQNHLKGDLNYSIKYYDKEQLEGQNNVVLAYDFSNKENYICDVEQIYEGIYVIDNVIKKSISLDKDDTSDGYIIKTTTTTLTEDDSDVDFSISTSTKEENVTSDYAFKQFQDKFFGYDLNGLYSQGLYYGDALYYMLDSNYMFMEINEEDNTLTYKLDKTYIETDNTYIAYEYKVDSYGMLLDYYNEMNDAPSEDTNALQRKVIIEMELSYN